MTSCSARVVYVIQLWRGDLRGGDAWDAGTCRRTGGRVFCGRGRGWSRRAWRGRGGRGQEERFCGEFESRYGRDMFGVAGCMVGRNGEVVRVHGLCERRWLDRRLWWRKLGRLMEVWRVRCGVG